MVMFFLNVLFRETIQKQVSQKNLEKLPGYLYDILIWLIDMKGFKE
jgi:hypothetical protein